MTLHELRARLPVTDADIERAADAPSGTLARVLRGAEGGGELQRVAQVLATAGGPVFARARIYAEGEVRNGWTSVELLVTCPGCGEEYRVGAVAPLWLRDNGDGTHTAWSETTNAIACPAPTLSCPGRTIWRPSILTIFEHEA